MTVERSEAQLHDKSHNLVGDEVDPCGGLLQELLVVWDLVLKAAQRREAAATFSCRSRMVARSCACCVRAIISNKAARHVGTYSSATRLPLAPLIPELKKNCTKQTRSPYP